MSSIDKNLLLIKYKCNNINNTFIHYLYIINFTIYTIIMLNIILLQSNNIIIKYLCVLSIQRLLPVFILLLIFPHLLIQNILTFTVNVI